MPDTLYRQDFYRWTQEQARALRAGTERGANLPVDWENVAEEIESLGQSDRREIISRLRTIIRHLLKLQCSPASEPRAGWRRTVTLQRIELADVLVASPSLRRELPTLIKQAAEGAVRLAVDDLIAHGESVPASHAALVGAHYTLDQVLDDWFPPEHGQP